ncbi:hypothetical protein JQ615_36830 [Bradyrhizobium jicamae]|uniref:Pilus assembly protein n=1 Tax=Bradyrhizobium jicamae TaxID=280332 RepID=A0ABS5FVS0_9BRAD|nr:hypothetical protein [Bradyrhizobium jicamae]MBR0800943.1 hypothetical protein [Bradyrhizobium jicamae]
MSSLFTIAVVVLIVLIASALALEQADRRENPGNEGTHRSRLNNISKAQP